MENAGVGTTLCVPFLVCVHAHTHVRVYMCMEPQIELGRCSSGTVHLFFLFEAGSFTSLEFVKQP